MRNIKWLSRGSIFGGFLTYMVASYQGLPLIASFEKALLATVVLYGLGVFLTLAFYQIVMQIEEPKPEENDQEDQTGMPPDHGTDGASWDNEPIAAENSIRS
jgi:hypothetical protein